MNGNGVKSIFFFLGLSALVASGCKNKSSCISSPDISHITLDLKVDRLDKKLFSLRSKAELEKLLDKNPVFREKFLFESQYPDDSILINRFYGLLHDPYIDTLWTETNQVFGDLTDIKSQFSDAFKRIKYYYPRFTPPRIQTAFTGLAHDMYISDSLIIIGLDYYLGESASYRPLNTPDYILKRYRKENIVPNTLLLLSEKFNKTDMEDKTLLADMVYYGKAYYFSKQMLPCVPDSIFLGYTQKEMHDINASKGVIWANFIENELLYETDYALKDKFISERPKTFEIGQNCPGRIGRWVGWEIVKAYMDKNDTTSFIGLMNNNDAKEIFRISRYKPRI